jgi:hypothetical protein
MTSYALPSMAHTVSESQQRSNAGAALFSAARAAAQQRGWWAAITRRPNSLRTLAQDHPNAKTGHFAGRQSVRLNDIRGTEGRDQGFDDKFYPLNDQTRQRWQSVARALNEGVVLAPVQLIQVGSAYYVRDGHHRVSVNRALGQEVIEAEVTVWEH